MVNYQDTKTFLLLTLKNWNTDPSLIIDLSRYTNPLFFSRRLKTSIYTSGCKQRAKYVEASAVENKEWSDESRDISWFCLQTEVAGRPPNLSRYYEEGEQTPATQRVVPRNVARHSRSGRNPKHTSRPARITSQPLCNKSSNFSNRMCGSSQWIAVRRPDGTVSGLNTPRPACYWPGGRFIRKNDFRCFVQELLTRSAEAHSLDFNCRLHPRLLPSWSATFPRGIQTTFLGVRTKIQLSEIESEQKRPLIRKCGPGACFYWLQLLLQPHRPAQLSSLLDTGRKCLGCLMKGWTVICW